MAETKRKPTVWEIVIQALVAAASAVITALTTTSCMGHGPLCF